MAKFLGALNDHVERLSRRATKPQIRHLRRAAAQYRRDIAALKRMVQGLARRLQLLEKQSRRAGAASPASESASHVRFSPAGLKSHRLRLGLSAKNYGRLIGVSGLTVYNWEARKSRPRQSQLARIVAIRGLGKREALHRLDQPA